MLTMAERMAHALLRAATQGMKHAEIAALLGCSRENATQVLAGQYSLSDERKVIARDKLGIPIESWALPPEDANDASHLETPQAARTSSIPPSRQPNDAAASEGCPAPSEAA